MNDTASTVQPVVSAGTWSRALAGPGRALVLGLGRSGFAAAEMLAGEGWDVLAIDARAVSPDRLDPLREAGVVVRDFASDVPDVHLDLAVVSPGLSDQNPWITELRQRGVPCCSELELGWSRHRGRTLAITGTNGKSTATAWCAAALRQTGVGAVPAGNFGPPACEVVGQDPAPEWLVLEVSSFQLETCLTFRAEVALLMNLAPNHLDRHGTMEQYLRVKARLFQAMQAGDVAVIPHALAPSFIPADTGRWMTFGADGESADWRYLDTGGVAGPEGAEVSVAGTPFSGAGVGVGAAGVLAALAAAGVAPEQSAAAGRSMPRLAHRMEPVGSFGGVHFVDDSKATNLAATSAALYRCGPGVRLIAGGRLKESDLNSMKEVLAENALAVYLIGEAAEHMASAWAGSAPCVPCGTLDRAVHTAWNEAGAGDTILLSPGCASFDQFNSFEERGAYFKHLVDALTKEKAG